MHATAELLPGSVVEVVHDGTWQVGTYRGAGAGSAALLVMLSTTGELAKLDAGQLVDVWDAAQQDVPTSTDEWARLHDEASALLARLPAHAFDLRPYWQGLVAGKTGSKSFRVTSAAVSAHLFATGSLAPPLAQRLAAGSLLAAASPALFKRRTLELAGPAVGGAPITVTGGGYRALSRATAAMHAEKVFRSALEVRLVRGAEPEPWPAATLPLLAELELLALGMGDGSKALHRVLVSLGRPASPEGAKELLLTVEMWVEGESDAAASLAYSSGVWLCAEITVDIVSRRGTYDGGHSFP